MLREKGEVTVKHILLGMLICLGISATARGNAQQGTCAAFATGTSLSPEGTYWFYAVVWARPSAAVAEADAKNSFLQDSLHGQPVGAGPYVTSNCTYAHGAVVGVIKYGNNKAPIGNGSYYIVAPFYAATTADAISQAMAYCNDRNGSQFDITVPCEIVVQW